MKLFSIKIACLVILIITDQIFAKDMIILVQPFQNTGSQQYSWISIGMTSSVISDLEKIKDITVISEMDRKKAVQEIQLSLTGMIDTEKAVKIGKLLGANVIFTGNYLVSGNKIRVNANLINVEKGNIEKSVKIDGTVEKIFDLQDEIVFTLLAETEKIQIADLRPIIVAEDVKKKIKESKRPILSAYELYSKGMQLLYSGNYQQAIIDFNKSIELEPKYAEAYLNRGITKGFLKNYQDEIADYNKALELNPRYISAYVWRSFAKGNLEDYRGALADCNEAINLDSKNALAYSYRGKAKIGLKDYHGAISDFDKAIMLFPKWAEAYFYRGSIKIMVFNDKDGGCIDLSKAGELGNSEAYDRIKKYCK